MSGSSESCLGNFSRFAIVLQRILIKLIEVSSKIRGRREKVSQPKIVSQLGLQMKAGMFANNVLRIVVVQSPIRKPDGFGTLNQKVTQLVKDHLGQRVIRVKRISGADIQQAGAIIEGEDIRTAFNRNPELPGAFDPDDIERVRIVVPGFAIHDDC